MWYRRGISFIIIASLTGHMVHHPRMGGVIKRFVNQIPLLDLEASIQPITRTVLRVRLNIQPEFKWDDKVLLLITCILLIIVLKMDDKCDFYWQNPIESQYINRASIFVDFIKITVLRIVNLWTMILLIQSVSSNCNLMNVWFHGST